MIQINHSFDADLLDEGGVVTDDDHLDIRRSRAYNARDSNTKME
jgi:hypothetical protein